MKCAGERWTTEKMKLHALKYADMANARGRLLLMPTAPFPLRVQHTRRRRAFTPNPSPSSSSIIITAGVSFRSERIDI